MTGRRENALHAHVHPGDLVQTLAGKDQTVLIHADAVTGALAVMADDPAHRLPCFPGKGPVAGPLHILPHAVNEDQRSIHRIVHRCLVAFREQIGHQAVLLVGQEGTQNALCIVKTGSCQAAAGQCDHGVSAPIAEQRIAGQNGLATGRIPAGNIGIGAQLQLTGNGVPEHAVLLDLLQPRIGFLQQLPAGRCFLFRGEHHFQIGGLTGCHGQSDLAAALDHTSGRTAVLGILRIGQPLHIRFCFKEVRIGVDLDTVITAGDYATGVVQRLSLTNRVFLRRHFEIGAQHQRAGFVTVIFNVIQHRGGILPVGHTQMALHLHIIHIITPHGGVIDGKLSQPAVAVFNRSRIGKLLRRQEICRIAAVQLFGHPVDQIDAHIGRCLGRNQKTLVTAGGRIDTGDGCIAAQTVCQQKCIFTGRCCRFQLICLINKFHIPHLSAFTKCFVTAIGIISKCFVRFQYSTFPSFRQEPM